MHKTAAMYNTVLTDHKFQHENTCHDVILTLEVH